MKTYRLNLIPGDGIGVDVVNEGVRVLKALAEKHGGMKFDFNTLPWSCAW